MSEALTFETIAAAMSGGGAKSEKEIDAALSLLPLRIVLQLTPREAARIVQGVYDAKREAYLRATR